MKASGLLPEPFASTFRYSMQNDLAKRIRPAFVYLTAEMFGLKPEAVDGYALATEFFHTMSIINDDLPAQDDGEKRREQKTLHLEFDVATAELTAGLMVNTADSLVAETDREHILNGALPLYVGQVLAGFAVGQHKDLALHGKPKEEVTKKELDEVAFLKTGLAIEMAIVGVAIVAGASSGIIDRLEKYAGNYGIAFQIQDDLLDAIEGPDGSGKTHDLDAKNRRVNHVHLLGETAAEQELRQRARLAKRSVKNLARHLDTTSFEEVVEAITDREYHR
jgi:geranylgeranyl diphosphate synthase type II